MLKLSSKNILIFFNTDPKLINYINEKHEKDILYIKHEKNKYTIKLTNNITPKLLIIFKTLVEYDNYINKNMEFMKLYKDTEDELFKSLLKDRI